MPASLRIYTSLVLLLFSLLSAGCDRSNGPQAKPAKSGPVPATVGIDAKGAFHVSAEDRCPVCAMKVAQYPKLVCAIELKDGRTFYFCGAGCMIRSWLHPETFLGAGRDALKRAVVQEYFSGRHLDALSVIWVAGSDVTGPMGPAFVPVKDEQAVETFMQRHGGRATFGLADLNDEKWEAITAKKAVPLHH